jgi:hypothetical protein
MTKSELIGNDVRNIGPLPRVKCVDFKPDMLSNHMIHRCYGEHDLAGTIRIVVPSGCMESVIGVDLLSSLVRIAIANHGSEFDTHSCSLVLKIRSDGSKVLKFDLGDWTDSCNAWVSTQYIKQSVMSQTVKQFFIDKVEDLIIGYYVLTCSDTLDMSSVTRNGFQRNVIAVDSNHCLIIKAYTETSRFRSIKLWDGDLTSVRTWLSPIDNYWLA